MTSGFSVAFVSQQTLDLAKEALLERGIALKSTLFAKSLRIIRTALRLSRVPANRLLRLGTRKGIYLGTSHTRALELLSNGTQAPICRPSVESVTEYWQALLLRRLTRAGSSV